MTIYGRRGGRERERETIALTRLPGSHASRHRQSIQKGRSDPSASPPAAAVGHAARLQRTGDQWDPGIATICCVQSKRDPLDCRYIYRMISSEVGGSSGPECGGSGSSSSLNQRADDCMWKEDIRPDSPDAEGLIEALLFTD